MRCTFFAVMPLSVSAARPSVVVVRDGPLGDPDVTSQPIEWLLSSNWDVTTVTPVYKVSLMNWLP